MALDAGWAAVIAGGISVIGVIVGGALTVGGNVLLYRIQNGRADRLAEIRRERLRGMLNGDKSVWRSINALCAAVGADEPTTTALLIEIDARASMKGGKVWALVSRAPWPEDLAPQE